MTVIVTSHRRTVRVTVSYDVTGAEPMEADWSKRAFVPDHATLTDQDGDVSYKVIGAVPKKDGTPSLNSAHHRSWRLTGLDTEPEWLQSLVRDYCADAGLEVPS